LIKVEESNIGSNVELSKGSTISKKKKEKGEMSREMFEKPPGIESIYRGRTINVAP